MKHDDPEKIPTEITIKIVCLDVIGIKRGVFKKYIFNLQSQIIIVYISHASLAENIADYEKKK